MKMRRYALALLLTITAVISCIMAGCTDNSESPEPSYPAVVTQAATTADKTAAAPTTAELTDENTTSVETETEAATEAYVEYHFRSSKLLSEHFEKHGGEFADDFGYATAAEYEKGASDVINNPEALFKYEAEDGDGVYYIENTNEFVILSTDGYIRTYFRPSSGKKYFDRQ